MVKYIITILLLFTPRDSTEVIIQERGDEIIVVAYSPWVEKILRKFPSDIHEFQGKLKGNKVEYTLTLPRNKKSSLQKLLK
jgi:hypothetical protein